MKTVLKFVLFIAVCVGLYVGFDFLWCRFITNVPFEFKWGSDVIIPLTTAVVVGVLVLFRDSRTDKK